MHMMLVTCVAIVIGDHLNVARKFWQTKWWSLTHHPVTLLGILSLMDALYMRDTMVGGRPQWAKDAR